MIGSIQVNGILSLASTPKRGRRTRITSDAMHVEFDGLTAGDFFLGDGNTLSVNDLGQVRDVELTVDNNGIANVALTKATLCQNIRTSFREEAIKLEGQQNVLLDLSQSNSNTGVKVIVQDAIITVEFEDINCSMPIDFAHSVDVTLTKNDDKVHIIELSTNMTLRGVDGEDSILVDFTSYDSQLFVEAGPNKRTEVIYRIDNIAVGKCVTKSY